MDSQERAFWDVHRPVVKLFLNDETFQVLTGKVSLLVNVLCPKTLPLQSPHGFSSQFKTHQVSTRLFETFWACALVELLIWKYVTNMNFGKLGTGLMKEKQLTQFGPDFLEKAPPC